MYREQTSVQRPRLGGRCRGQGGLWRGLHKQNLNGLTEPLWLPVPCVQNITAARAPQLPLLSPLPLPLFYFPALRIHCFQETTAQRGRELFSSFFFF